MMRRNDQIKEFKERRPNIYKQKMFSEENRVLTGAGNNEHA